jgi:hypothetical protein
MSFPFAGFSSYLFANDERPVRDSDTDWNVAPTVNRSRSLGTATDRIQAMAIGSAERSFELFLEPARFATLKALINTTATFTDWTRPTPDSRSAYLQNVRSGGNIAVLCSDGATRRKIRALVTLISQ